MAGWYVPVRRGQVISPFGVGAMVMSTDGVSMMTAGLDNWFVRDDGHPMPRSEIEKHTIDEWRLQRFLDVDHFRMPPAKDTNEDVSGNSTYAITTIPSVRFPTWHFCPNAKCRALVPLTLSAVGRPYCKACEANSWKFRLSPVPFIVVCEVGHAADFPWLEWVHHEVAPPCRGPLTLLATGGASLAAQEVKCNSCGMRRTLEGVTSESGLAKLASDGPSFSCPGTSPWHGGTSADSCLSKPRGALRSATNVYFPVVRSSIFIPRDGGALAPPALISEMESSSVAMILRYVLGGDATDLNARRIRDFDPALFDGFSDTQIVKASRIVLGLDLPESPEEGPFVASDDRETAFRRVEHSIIRIPQQGDQLRVKEVEQSFFGKIMSRSFDRVLLVQRLRETRALVGFQRVKPTPNPDFAALKAMLRRRASPTKWDDWLPAHVVFGEGILLEFSDARVREWESRSDVVDRIQTLRENYSAQLRLQDRDPIPYTSRLSSRRVMLHTFAHLMINELSFDAGYSSASLRERLYVSDDEGHPMAAVLIYTAAGDADGSLGGLVRMGEPDRLEGVLSKAIEGSRWCASDPICMEAGDHGGQGPSSCNLAACHNCGLVPETTCEEFNQFLDRWMVTGNEDDRSGGFFE